MPDTRFDPLGPGRVVDGPEFDVFMCGVVFLDIIFTGMDRQPGPGTEELASGMASCPGGIANLAVAARRLGLRTALAAAFSEDDYGDFCWRTMEEGEHVDLTHSRRFADWHSPVTVSMSVDRDRSMVTHAHPAPVPATELVGDPPPSRAVIVDLGDGDGGSLPDWVTRARTRGALVFADVGWDPTATWDPEVLDRLAGCDAFMPNAVEAMAYTRTETPQEALYALADRVPLVVVTNGPHGALAIDAGSGEEVSVPALRVDALDPTGAGDVFGAALLLGTLASWGLADRVNFASLCASLAIQQFGGSLAAPGWGDLADWWQARKRDWAGSAYHRALRRRFAFLDALMPQVPPGACRRATATIARRADIVGLA
ncbi:MAG: carbohydrate kinase family protein [Tetrasphaera sp.]|jgi:sugar/nucleoside kinase (ribokinase family)|nr:carbohydrate kinase family protein [Tetrasphaera sp.]